MSSTALIVLYVLGLLFWWLVDRTLGPFNLKGWLLVLIWPVWILPWCWQMVKEYSILANVPKP